MNHLIKSLPKFILGVKGQVELSVDGRILPTTMLLSNLDSGTTIDVTADLGMWRLLRV